MEVVEDIITVDHYLQQVDLVVLVVEQDHLIQLHKVVQAIHLLLVHHKVIMAEQEILNQIKAVVVLVEVEQYVRVNQIKFYLVQEVEILEEMVEQE